jgi:hypothetical protein
MINTLKKSVRTENVALEQNVIHVISQDVLNFTSVKVIRIFLIFLDVKAIIHIHLRLFSSNPFLFCISDFNFLLAQKAR